MNEVTIYLSHKTGQSSLATSLNQDICHSAEATQPDFVDCLWRTYTILSESFSQKKNKTKNKKKAPVLFLLI